jgi:hypothetical protein
MMDAIICFRFSRDTLLRLGLVLAGVCAVVLQADGREKRLIAHSWDLLAMRPADVARNVKALEKLPLDGVSLAIVIEPEKGRRVGYGTIMGDARWERAWFEQEKEVVKQCASRALSHNFLTSFWAPRKRLAWDDDNAWATFAHNLGVLAWLAKEGGAKGILADPEDYPETRQYRRLEDDPPFDAVSLLARKRGAQVMQAMTEHYPDIVVLSFWLLSLHPSYYIGCDSPVVMAAEAGDLWPSFVNGLLDALPPTARLVDGNEHGYRYEAANKDFYFSAWSMQNRALALVAPENHFKYRTQALAGFGLYLDMYTNPPGSPWYFGEVAGSRLNHLALNVAQALDAADEYVWIYGEKHDWIRWSGTTRTNATWESVLPGFSDTLRILRRPSEADIILDRRRQAGTLTNLLTNGACASAEKSGSHGFTPGRLPSAWGCWQRENRAQGLFGTDTQKGLGDASSLRAEGVGDGCFIAKTPVLAGGRYAVEAFSRGVAPRIRVRWNKEGRWHAEALDVMIRFGEAGTNGWRRAFGVVQVPAGTDTLVLLLGMEQKAGETTWFDNAAVFPLVGP